MDHDDMDLIPIRLPIPLTVSSALIAAVGKMWPDAVIRTDHHLSHNHLVLGLPKKAPKRVTDRTFMEVLRDNLPDGDSIPDAHLTGVKEDGTFTFGLDSRDEAWLSLGSWAYIVLRATEGADNYVQQKVHVDTPLGTKTLLITCCWSPEVTPAELHAAQKARADELEQELAKLRAEIQEEA